MLISRPVRRTRLRPIVTIRARGLGWRGGSTGGADLPLRPGALATFAPFSTPAGAVSRILVTGLAPSARILARVTAAFCWGVALVLSLAREALSFALASRVALPR